MVSESPDAHPTKNSSTLWCKLAGSISLIIAISLVCNKPVNNKKYLPKLNLVTGWFKVTPLQESQNIHIADVLQKDSIKSVAASLIETYKKYYSTDAIPRKTGRYIQWLEEGFIAITYLMPWAWYTKSWVYITYDTHTGEFLFVQTDGRNTNNTPHQITSCDLDELKSALQWCAETYQRQHGIHTL